MLAFPYTVLNGLLVTVLGRRYHPEPAEVGNFRLGALLASKSPLSACCRDQKQLLLALACKAQKRPVTPHSVLEDMHHLRDIIAGEVDLCGWSVTLIRKDGKKTGKRVGTVDEIIELALVEGRANDDDAVLRPFEASAMGGSPGPNSDTGVLRRLQEDKANGRRMRGPRELLLRVVGEEEEPRAKPRKGTRGRRAQTQAVAVAGIDGHPSDSDGAVQAQEHAATPDPDKVEHLIPLVPSIVVSADVKRRCLVINPPEGLLELGRQQHCLQRLLPVLMEFCEEREREGERERQMRGGEAAWWPDGDREEPGAAAGELPS